MISCPQIPLNPPLRKGDFQKLPPFAKGGGGDLFSFQISDISLFVVLLKIFPAQKCLIDHQLFDVYNVALKVHREFLSAPLIAGVD